MSEEIKNKAVELSDEEMDKVAGGMQRILEYNHKTQMISAIDCYAFKGTMDNFYACCFQHKPCTLSGTLRHGCTEYPKFWSGGLSWDLKILTNLDIPQLVSRNCARLVED